MSDPDRLSHARTVGGLHQEPSALDRQAQSNPSFNQAASGEQAPHTQQGRGSEMVEKDGSRMHHRPSDDLAAGQTRQDFDKAWSDEQRAASRASELRARYAKPSNDDAMQDSQSQRHSPGQRM